MYGYCPCDGRHLPQEVREASTDASIDAPFVDLLVNTQKPTARGFMGGTTAKSRNIGMKGLSPVWINELVPESLEIRVVEERGGGCFERAVGEDDVAGDLVGQPACHQYSHNDLDWVGDLRESPSVIAFCFLLRSLSICSCLFGAPGGVDSSAADLRSGSTLSVRVGHCVCKTEY